MNEIFIIILLITTNAILLLSLFKRPKIELKDQLNDLMSRFDSSLTRIENSIKDELQRNRQESNINAKSNREELSKSLNGFSENFSGEIKEFNSLLRQKFGDFSKQQAETNQKTTNDIREIKSSVEKNLKDVREDNTKQLDQIRITVDEKLQKTLNDRLSHSFETVGKQLKSVQEGLGEMKSLASDVGGLKKVLSNVKMRGGVGETQLGMLLEQILAPDQYEANVSTKQNSSDIVEFVIKLPGRDDSGSVVYLPIDAKFPKDTYEKLVDSYDLGDQNLINLNKKNMENTIKKMARDITEKYIDPPNTTEFGIMFLPFESIYAEVIRNVSLLETLQRDFKIIVTGPTTLAAILNSLQMGFKTLAIEKRSGEVWKILGAVKKEFEKFEHLLDKAGRNIETGLNQIRDGMGTRTRAINRSLRNVESLSDKETKNILPESSEATNQKDT